jgi:hypothetical protein
LVDAEIKRHGRSKEGLQKMIETMQCFHRISTGEYALDDAGCAQAWEALKRARKIK